MSTSNITSLPLPDRVSLSKYVESGYNILPFARAIDLSPIDAAIFLSQSHIQAALLQLDALQAEALRRAASAARQLLLEALPKFFGETANPQDRIRLATLLTRLATARIPALRKAESVQPHTTSDQPPDAEPTTTLLPSNEESDLPTIPAASSQSPSIPSPRLGPQPPAIPTADNVTFNPRPPSKSTHPHRASIHALSPSPSPASSPLRPSPLASGHNRPAANTSIP